MKRFHVHVSVENFGDSIRFYSTLFGAAPTIQKDDYAKWMIEDPRVNFAISRRGHASGVDHLGFQVETGEELKAIQSQLIAADVSLLEQKDASCCYAKSDKYWVMDPTGIAWETFHTLDSVPVYGKDAKAVTTPKTCCPPIAMPEKTTQSAKCC